MIFFRNSHGIESDVMKFCADVKKKFAMQSER